MHPRGSTAYYIEGPQKCIMDAPQRIIPRVFGNASWSLYGVFTRGSSEMHRGASSAHNLEGRRKCILEALRRIIARVLRNAAPRPSDVFLFSSTRSFSLRYRLAKIRGGGPIARGDWMAICGRAKKKYPQGLSTNARRLHGLRAFGAFDHAGLK